MKRIMTNVDIELGRWMSAALDDDSVCEEMKTDIKNWFESFYISQVVKCKSCEKKEGFGIYRFNLNRVIFCLHCNTEYIIDEKKMINTNLIKYWNYLNE